MTVSEIHKIYLACNCQLTTDSRKVKAGDIFWALKGENFDGNQFALKALEAGAAYAVVDADSLSAITAPIADVATSANAVTPAIDGVLADTSRLIPVENTLKALWKLATYHRENTLHDDRRIKMFALTGTNGKTTTKELVKAVLSVKYNLTATSGNLNNNIGVPLTLLQMTPQTELAVVEMGASHPGDIKELVDIAHPDFGLITNVGRAHLLGFGSFEGVKKTKGELYDYLLGVRGTCFVNSSSEDLKGMASEREGLLTVEYGRDAQSAAILPVDDEHPFLRMEFTDTNNTRHTVNTHLVGSYNADNVLAAIAVGAYFGVDTDAAVKAIETYIPSNNRSQMQKTASNTLIVDAYNANPSSMAAALENFANVNASRKAVCLGDMLELGSESEAEHAKVVERIEAMTPDAVVLVGAEFTKVAGGKFQCFPNSDAAAEYVASLGLKDFTVLVKGSRGTKMEKLIPVL